MVDVDTSAFFDEVDHDILMARVGGTIRNKRVLRLIGAYLRAPLRWEGREEKRNRGTPQGGPLSPLLANITLDALDRELERRTLSFCRYADDVAIFVTRERILESLTAWIAKHLKLRVNATKSGVDRPWNGTFLGFRITGEGRIAPAPGSLERLKDRVRKVWNACWSTPLEDRIRHWQAYIRGWSAYFGVCDSRW